MRFPGPITRVLAPRTATQVGAVLLLIECIFLTESFTGLLETVIEHSGSAWDFLTILLLTTPEIFDFALPLALLVGAYSALISAREDNEFVACSAAGLSWNRISGFVLALGLGSFALSLAVSGYINPAAAGVKRAMLWDIQARAILQRITGPGERDAVQTIDGWTFISTGSTANDRERGHLFIHHPPDGLGVRVTQAEDWTLNGPHADGSYTLSLKQVTDHPSFVRGFPGAGEADSNRSAGIAGPADYPHPGSRYSGRAQDVSLPLHLDEIMQQAEDARAMEELTLLEVVAGIANAQASDGPVQRRGGELLGRALLCPAACLFALVAVVFTHTGIARYLVLPGAALSMLVFDTVSRALLGQAAQSGPSFLILVASIVAGMSALPLILVILFRGERIVTPAFART